jgi:aryl-alcohol dehydrogenase-like predicted oxidoreductase
MRYRKLGNSDLAVSEISLGSWLTFAGGVAAEQTRACTQRDIPDRLVAAGPGRAHRQGQAPAAAPR